MDEVQARHRKEQRDLQSRITQKKKQANKKTRKGVNDECDRLEAELKSQQQGEIAALNGEPVNGIGTKLPAEKLEGLTLQDDEEDGTSTTNDVPNGNDETNPDHRAIDEQTDGQSQSKKPHRQKARLARRAAEQEELAKRAAEEAKNMPDMKQQERERMLEYMKERSLVEKEIRADGHCLYSAVADQLDQLQLPIGAAPDEKPALHYKAIRAAAAEYIEKHQDDFIPFLEEPLADYLHKVKDTGEWGGQLELMALAKTYGADINVLQDFGRVEKIESGNETSEKTMWLGYYKHGFGLGEHYNSLRKAR